MADSHEFTDLISIQSAHNSGFVRVSHNYSVNELNQYGTAQNFRTWAKRTVSRYSSSGSFNQSASCVISSPTSLACCLIPPSLLEYMKCRVRHCRTRPSNSPWGMSRFLIPFSLTNRADMNAHCLGTPIILAFVIWKSGKRFGQHWCLTCE